MLNNIVFITNGYKYEAVLRRMCRYISASLVFAVWIRATIQSANIIRAIIAQNV